jgi:hypothetical protein
VTITKRLGLGQVFEHTLDPSAVVDDDDRRRRRPVHVEATASTMVPMVASSLARKNAERIDGSRSPEWAHDLDLVIGHLGKQGATRLCRP